MSEWLAYWVLQTIVSKFTSHWLPNILVFIPVKLCLIKNE